jgi:hypothetical protein
MFNSISWQEFLTTIAIVAGAYYFVSVLLLYSKEIIQKLKGQNREGEKAAPAKEAASSSLMGSARKDPPKKHEHSIDAEDLAIDDSTSTDMGSEESLLIGSVSDLIHEIKVLAKVIRESSGAKEDGAPMFQSLLSNYPQLSATKYRASLNLLIHEQCRNECGFEIELIEIDAGWPSAESQNNQ